MVSFRHAKGLLDRYRVAAAIMVAAAAAVQVWGSQTDRVWVLWLTTALTLVLALGIWIAGELRSWRERTDAVEIRSETLLDLGAALEPLANELGRVAAMPTVGARRVQWEGLKRTVLAAACGLSEAKLRACYFELNDAQTELVLAGYTGRSIQPKQGFKRGERSGDTAIDMVIGREHRFCDNTEENPPPGWSPSRSGEYKTFISVAVGTPSNPIGMLTLDSPDPGDLTKEDLISWQPRER